MPIPSTYRRNGRPRNPVFGVERRLHRAGRASFGQAVALNQVHVKTHPDEVLNVGRNGAATAHAQLEAPAHHVVHFLENFGAQGGGAPLLERQGARGKGGQEQALNDRRTFAHR